MVKNLLMPIFLGNELKQKQNKNPLKVGLTILWCANKLVEPKVTINGKHQQKLKK
jgi:hypothetical protein